MDRATLRQHIDKAITEKTKAAGQVPNKLYLNPLDYQVLRDDIAVVENAYGVIYPFCDDGIFEIVSILPAVFVNEGQFNVFGHESVNNSLPALSAPDDQTENLPLIMIY